MTCNKADDGYIGVLGHLYTYLLQLLVYVFARAHIYTHAHTSTRRQTRTYTHICMQEVNLLKRASFELDAL